MANAINIILNVKRQIQNDFQILKLHIYKSSSTDYNLIVLFFSSPWVYDHKVPTTSKQRPFLLDPNSKTPLNPASAYYFSPSYLQLSLEQVYCYQQVLLFLLAFLSLLSS